MESARVRRHGGVRDPGAARAPRWFSRCGPFTRIGHIPGGGRPLLRDGGPISYQARPSSLVNPKPQTPGMEPAEHEPAELHESAGLDAGSLPLYHLALPG